MQAPNYSTSGSYASDSDRFRRRRKDRSEPASARYAEMCGARAEYLERGYSMAEYTFPHYLPRERPTRSTRLRKFASAFPGTCVANLGSRLTLSLMPATTSYFRLEGDAIVAYHVENDPYTEWEWNERLKLFERATLQRLESMRMRVALHENLIHQIIHGNVVLYYDSANSRARNFPIDQFVIERDGAGAILDLIICEEIAFSALEEKHQEMLQRERKRKGTREDYKPKDKIKLYTCAQRQNSGKVDVWQELEELYVEDFEKSYDDEDFPFIVPRIRPVSGESYSHSYCEEHAGDFWNIVQLQKALIQGTMLSVRCIPFVSPNGTTSVRQLQKAENLQFISGESKDVTFLQPEKQADLAVGQQMLEYQERRIGQAFLLYSALAQAAGRDRVTAEEIRRLSEEADVALGGLYSAESIELGTPIIRLAMRDVAKDPRYSIKINDRLIIPRLITGMEAYGRNAELDRLAVGADTMAKVMGPDAFRLVAKKRGLASMILQAAGVNPATVLMSEDEIQAAEEAALTQNITANAAPKVLTEMAKQATQGAAPAA